MTNLSFDSRNRLIQAGNTIYRYDGENQRVAVNQTQFVINSQPALSQVLVKTEADGTRTFYVYGLGLIGEETNGQYRAYLFDFRGSTVALSDNLGNVTQRFQYSAYGELVSRDATQTPFLFNGMYGVMTDVSGLYYMRARYYSPEIKRFVNQDVLLGEINEGQSLNRFAFVTGQPVNFIDPFGFMKEDVVAIIVFIHQNVPDIKIGRYEFADISERALSQTTILGTILLDKKYLQPICNKRDFINLVDNLLHEGMHSTDSILTRYQDASEQPNMTSNHQSIYDRVAWELGKPILEPEIPMGKTLDDFIGKRGELYFVSPLLWGKPERIRIKGDNRNPNSLMKGINSLYDSLYGAPLSCGCSNNAQQ